MGFVEVEKAERDKRRRGEGSKPPSQRPNLLTFARAVGHAAAIALLYGQEIEYVQEPILAYSLAAILIGISTFADSKDGQLARDLNSSTRFGERFDHVVADPLMFTSMATFIICLLNK